MKSIRNGFRLRFALLLLAVTAAAAWGAASSRRAAAPRTFLVWMSIDGLPAEYLERAETPAFDRLIREGASTSALVPVFPPLTFPSHVSQATGVPVSEHGVPLNSFHDRARNRVFHYPSPAFLLEAEPIWTTARRQGLRVAVLDWPLSHRQTGAYAADVFGDRYDGRLTDDDRAERLLSIWRRDRGREPLRLLMGYGDDPDRAGHRHGPGAPEIADMIAAVDARLGRFVEGIVGHFERRRRPGDQLFLFVTSDHGMTPVHTAVHVERLAGIEGREDVLTLTAGPVALLYLHAVEPPEARRALEDEILRRVAEWDFVRGYTRETLPEPWGFDHPGRTGDLTLLLRPGYAFNRRAREIASPVSEVGGHLGTHGYDPGEDPGMASLAIFWRYPEPYGGIRLGPVHALQLHATAAAVLGIKPADGARADPIPLPGLAPPVP